jgi:hypothetical protein
MVIRGRADQGATFCERWEVPAGVGFTESVHEGRRIYVWSKIEALLLDDGPQVAQREG